jgi:urease accessory protein
MKANRLPVFNILMLSLPAQAHTGAGTVHGFNDGLLHPLLGIDHLLVMLAIGLWAAVRGGRALRRLPMSFLLTMATGAGVSLLSIAITAAESWMAFSVLACGLVWSNCLMSLGLAVVLVAAFEFGHGYVHAAGLQAGADAVSYAAGILLATVLLHGLGIAAGLSARLKTIGAGFGLLCAIAGTSLLAGA